MSVVTDYSPNEHILPLKCLSVLRSILVNVVYEISSFIKPGQDGLHGQ